MHLIKSGCLAEHILPRRKSRMLTPVPGVLLGMLLLAGATRVVAAATQGSAPADTGTAGVRNTTFPHDPGFAKIMVVAKTGADSVVLRWAPNTPHAWRLGNRIGYIVEKQEGGSPAVRATPDTIHPWSIKRFVDAINADTANSYLGLALYSLSADTSLFGMADSLGLDTVGTRAEMNTTLYSYALFSADNDPLVADGLGLRFVDTHVRKGARVTYRVRLSSGRDYRIDPGQATVTVGTTPEGLPPGKFFAKGQDRRIALSWQEQARQQYSGYFVFRSDDGGKTYRKLNRQPLVIVTPADSRLQAAATYADTTIVNYKVYRYRVRGVDAFGGLGRPAEAEAYGRDLTPPPPPFIRNPEQLGKDSIRLTWAMPLTSPDLAGFVVDRSANPDSGFHRLTKRNLPASIREFIDHAPSEREPYYAVGSIDTAGNAAMSLPVYAFRVDTLPPAVPAGLRGTIDTNGIVRLRWRRGPEKNILGYRILRANAPDHEFEQLSGRIWKDTSYTDTVSLSTLTSHVYYRVAAVNSRYNPSPMSPILSLRRPDVVPPVSPVFTDVIVTDSSAILRWVPSSSADVRAHELFRRLPPASAWTLLATLRPKDGTYVDRAVEQNTAYEYTIDAVDSAGLRSPAAVPVLARPYDPGVRPLVYGLSADYRQEGNSILLKWEYTAKRKERYFFVIFRSARNGPLEQFASVPSSQSTFTDTSLLGGGTYSYAVKVMTADGAESPRSGRVQVIVPGK